MLKSLLNEETPYGLQLFKKRLQHRCFPVNTGKFLNAYFEEHFQMPASGETSGSD